MRKGAVSEVVAARNIGIEKGRKDKIERLAETQTKKGG